MNANVINTRIYDGKYLWGCEDKLLHTVVLQNFGEHLTVSN